MTRKRIKQIERIASQILENTNCGQLPIDPTAIAEKNNIRVVDHEVSDDVSGVLFIESGSAVIGVNPTHSPVRQRFTIAHELGHFFLAHERGGLFVDRPSRHFTVMYRDTNSSTGEIEQEKEANAFAAALLMPAKCVAEKVEQYYQYDLSDDHKEDETLKRMAKDFKVSSKAMEFRILNLARLGLISAS